MELRLELVLVLLLVVGSSCSERKKRYLIFPQGSNVQVVYCLTIAADARSSGDLVLGLTTALAWALPTKVEPSLIDKLHRHTRAALYPKIEAFLSSAGLDGRSCVMRALCEVGQRREPPGSDTFLRELLHAVFTLRNDGTTFEDEDAKRYDHADRGDCEELYPECRHSIYDLEF